MGDQTREELPVEAEVRAMMLSITNGESTRIGDDRVAELRPPSGVDLDDARPLGNSLERALREHGLAVVSRFQGAVLAQECGLGAEQAERLATSFRLGREAERARLSERPSLKRPDEVARYLAPEFRGLEVETFHALVLDARHRLKARVEVSRGTLTMAPVHPREVFAPAVRLMGAAVIVAHNHPSGDPDPSAEDFEVTRRLVDAGALLGIPLLDHIVCAGERWVSIRESGQWPSAAGAQPGATSTARPLG